MSQPQEPVVIVASAEFTLKSSPVRRTLEQRLMDDLKVSLKRTGFDGFRVEKDTARLIVIGLREPLAAAEACSRVFGVAYAAPAILLPASKQPLMESILALAKDSLRSGQSFAIRAHRSAPGTLSRREVEIDGGSEVLHALKERGVRVDLDEPDVTIYVDLAADRAYVYSTKLQGPGGLPLSSQWKMLAVLDSGPLTLLAAYSMMRRGCLVELFIPLSSHVSAFAKDSQLKFARTLRLLVTRPSYRAFTVELEGLLGDGFTNEMSLSKAKYVVRMAAAKFAKEKKFKGIIFPDIDGDIRFLQSPRNGEFDLPVFTPLIGLDAKDLSELAALVGIEAVDLVPLAEIREEAVPEDSWKAVSDVRAEELSL